MWTTLVVVALGLTPAQGGEQGGKLAITNPRFTYGMLGVTRPYLAYDVTNLKFDQDGRAAYSIGMEILDGAGKSLFQQNPTNQLAQNCLGGPSLPSVATINIPPETPAGKYTIRLTVEDRTTKQKATLDREAEVLKPAFGLVQVHLTSDADGKVAMPPGGVIGQQMYVNFSVVGFGRDAKQKHPQVHVALRILDDKGQPTFGKGLIGKADKDVPEDFKAIPLQFGLVLNRPGDYVLELSADCQLDDAPAVRVRLPIRCVQLK
jgi:hypothetical protein